MVATDSRSAVRDYLAKYEYKFVSLIDQYGSAMRDFKVKGIPASFIVNREGKIVTTLTGETDWQTMKPRLLELLE